MYKSCLPLCNPVVGTSTYVLFSALCISSKSAVQKLDKVFLGYEKHKSSKSEIWLSNIPIVDSCVWGMPQDLGWSATDTEALCPLSAQPAPDAAAPVKSKAAAATKKPGSADKGATTAGGASTAMAEEVVTGFDTPCHVAAVSEHHTAVLQVVQRLAASVAELKGSMYCWQRNEEANKERWAALLRSLGDIV